MKLESTLSDRAGMLYTGPLIDVILLLIIFFLFGSNIILKSGVEVKLPASSSVLPTAEDAHIVTLIANDASEFFFNDQRVDVEQLGELIPEAIERSDQVILLGDARVPYGVVMDISEVFLKNDFEVIFATQQQAQ